MFIFTRATSDGLTNC